MLVLLFFFSSSQLTVLLVFLGFVRFVYDARDWNLFRKEDWKISVIMDTSVEPLVVDRTVRSLELCSQKGFVSSL